MSSPTLRRQERLPRFNQAPQSQYTGPRFTVTPDDVPVVLPTELPKGPLTGKNDEMAGEPVESLPTFSAPATRPRMATDVPGEANPMSEAERLNANLRGELDSPVESSALKSAGYGAVQAGSQAAKSGSLGFTLGAALAGAASGALNKKLYGQAKKAARVAEAEGKQKIASEAEEQAAKVRLTNAQATVQESLPTFKTEEQQRKEAADKSRAGDQRSRVLASMFNRAEDFDPDDPANADMVAEMKAANLPVYAKKRGQQMWIKQDAKTGAWYAVAGDKTTGTANASAVADGSGGQLTTTSPQAMNAEQQAANRASREKIAAILVGSREQLAAKQMEIERERLNISREQNQTKREQWEAGFKAKHPGYGKKLTAAQIAAKYRQIKERDPQTKLTEDFVLSDAIEQGYEIVP